jgi:ribosomal protein S18 acetylase RimI-like enzyme
VVKEYRGKNIGRKLLEKCIEIAKERDYCKITLEVRDDNTVAKNLYKSLDFRECIPVMHFWTKTL